MHYTALPAGAGVLFIHTPLCVVCLCFEYNKAERQRGVAAGALFYTYTCICMQGTNEMVLVSFCARPIGRK